MILHFQAEAVEIEETELGVLVVGFYTEENYLMIQQSLDEPDELENERRGMNAYHIERDDQSFGGYGGVRQIILRRDSIETEFDETGKENLQCNGVKVDFPPDSTDFELLAEKLRLIFGDSLTVDES